MTDLEVSKALALAIGHDPKDIFVYEDCVEVSDHVAVEDRIFDYRDWNIAGPIAERYGLLVDFKTNVAWFGNKSVGQRGGTPQKAIALAVIEGAKK